MVRYLGFRIEEEVDGSSVGGQAGIYPSSAPHCKIKTYCCLSNLYRCMSYMVAALAMVVVRCDLARDMPISWVVPKGCPCLALYMHPGRVYISFCRVLQVVASWALLGCDTCKTHVHWKTPRVMYDECNS